MAMLEERVCGLEDRVGVMRRLMMRMAWEIEALRGELSDDGQAAMAATDVMLPTQEATAEANGMVTGSGQHARAAAKRSQSESSTSQRIPLFRFTVVQNSMVDGVATKLDTRQALEAENRQATQATAQGQAEGRFMIRDGQRHPINLRNGLPSAGRTGREGSIPCELWSTSTGTYKAGETHGEANGLRKSDCGAHQPEHITRVKLMAKPMDCGKLVPYRVEQLSLGRAG
eukprot:scaffold59972_cov68-Attheya_sp.AAC.2